ncbi:hypothetical protein J4Q44_G00285960 [Coregonus suidteri]|uniref:Uncharacterized protein n=1 Tax=Coregonus suidteri TaxID=861788 RepID=A0AAN8QK58_9TELE
MPQTANNPLGLCIGAKTIPERKQIYSCTGATDPVPERKLMYSGSGILDPVPEHRYRQAYPSRYRWKWRKKSKKNPLPLPPAPPLPQYEEENWEEEIGIVETYGFAPYGPEDVDSVALQGLTLNQTPCPPHPQTAADYSPATHHQAPVKWVRHINRIMEEQFVDAVD